MNEIEPGPSETQHMIAINEALRTELERLKTDYRNLLESYSLKHNELEQAMDNILALRNEVNRMAKLLQELVST